MKSSYNFNQSLQSLLIYAQHQLQVLRSTKTHKSFEHFKFVKIGNTMCGVNVINVLLLLLFSFKSKFGKWCTCWVA